MKALSYYLTYPVIRLIAALPFSVLYRLSDGLARLLIWSGYRREVVEMNLRNSFPAKSAEEIKALSNDYFHYLCDLILETLKTMTMSEEEYRKRVTLNNPEVFASLAAQNKSIILMLGHFGNWEWFGPCVTLKTDFQLNVIYRPLSHPHFERLTASWRTRFGTEITPVQQTLRSMVANKNRLTATAFISDQYAPGQNYWTTFLNQETAVFTGAEKIASKFGYPVVYLHAKRPKRGYYIITPEILFMDPAMTTDNQISEAFTRRLEKDIVENPVIWLWSHKRWKNKRPTGA
ncbi:MAG: lysophospholipid acyltransferase family protein [Cyclobacteriaceae bacterium]|nr:lysophospholipid acyltransferase family protein [Cyclobacteriaceae bacterium]